MWRWSIRKGVEIREMGWEGQIMRIAAKTKINNLGDCMQSECSKTS